jgi:hypothetical protein
MHLHVSVEDLDKSCIAENTVCCGAKVEPAAAKACC